MEVGRAVPLPNRQSTLGAMPDAPFTTHIHWLSCPVSTDEGPISSGRAGGSGHTAVCYCLSLSNVMQVGICTFTSLPGTPTCAGHPRQRKFPFLSHRLVGLVVKASALRAEDPRFESRLRRVFFFFFFFFFFGGGGGVESYQWLQNWRSSGYPPRRLVL